MGDRRETGTGWAKRAPLGRPLPDQALTAAIAERDAWRELAQALDHHREHMVLTDPPPKGIHRAASRVAAARATLHELGVPGMGSDSTP